MLRMKITMNKITLFNEIQINKEVKLLLIRKLNMFYKEPGVQE